MKPYSRDISSTVTPHTSEECEIKWAANLAIDTSWTWTATPSNVTANTGKVAVQSVTFAAKAGTTEGDFIHLVTADNVEFAIALDVDGTGVANAGPVYSAVPVANVIVVDISGVGVVLAADVAAAVAAALALNAPFSAAFTVVDNADGSLSLTAAVRGPLTVAASYVADESGVGSITTAEVTAGVASAFDVTANTIAATGHGLTTGHVVRLTISGGGTLPDPFLVATDYYAIKVTDDVLKLATSRANADAGSAINIADQGTADKTVTLTVQANSGSVLLQYCSDIEISDSSVWRTLASIDIDNETSPNQYRLASNYYHFVRCTLAIPSGFLSTFKCEAFGKGL